jgi:hypothetical protein
MKQGLKSLYCPFKQAVFLRTIAFEIPVISPIPASNTSYALQKLYLEHSSTYSQNSLGLALSEKHLT